MKTPFLKTYAAIVVLLGLGAYIYFVESKKEAKPEKPKEKVFVLAKAKIRELILSPADGPEIHIVKDNKDWKMTAPHAVMADSSEVDALASSLEALEYDEVVVDNPPRLADFGLEKPKLTIGIVLQGATEPLKVLIGDKAPDGSSLYAKVPSQPKVFTLPAYLEGSFNKKPFDLRDRDLLHVKRDAVRTIEVSGPEGSYALARDPKGEWLFTKPVSTRAGRWAVDGLLGNLENLRMEKVAAEEAKDPKPFGLAKPVRAITLELNDGAVRRLEIGSSPEPKKYNAREARSPLVAVIPSALVDDLAKGMGELRAKRLVEIAAYEVQGFDVERDGAKRVYSRSSTKDKEGVDVYKWKRTTPDAKDLDTNKVQDVLFKVGGVEVAEFLDSPGAPEKYGFDKPALKVNFTYPAPKPSVSFEIGQKDGTSYARRSGDDAVLKLDASKADEVLKAFKEL